jgi:hypothetical protein
MTTETITVLNDVAARLHADLADSEPEDRVIGELLTELFTVAAEQATIGHDCSLLDVIGRLAPVLIESYEAENAPA